MDYLKKVRRRNQRKYGDGLHHAGAGNGGSDSYKIFIIRTGQMMWGSCPWKLWMGTPVCQCGLPVCCQYLLRLGTDETEDGVVLHRREAEPLSFTKRSVDLRVPWRLKKSTIWYCWQNGTTYSESTPIYDARTLWATPRRGNLVMRSASGFSMELPHNYTISLQATRPWLFSLRRRLSYAGCGARHRQADAPSLPPAGADRQPGAGCSGPTPPRTAPQ